MVFDGTEAMAAAEASVTAAMNKTFGIRRYTTTEGWLVGGLEGNGEANQEAPRASPVWRIRIDKARREIEELQREERLKDAQALRDSVAKDTALTIVVNVAQEPVEWFAQAINNFKSKAEQWHKI
jgi:hypothetical protein